ncbi:hypothetical protein ACYSNM_05000 [Myroides sp. LJL116]
MKKIGLLIALFSLVTLNSLMAQGGDTKTASHTISVGIPSVSLVDIEGETGGGITLALTAPTEAGEALGNSLEDKELWLNYSFIPTAADKQATITVSATDISAGMILTVSAGMAAQGAGGGKLGTAVPTAITLGGMDSSDIITEIGASYTGNGPSNGHNLTYSLKYDTDNYSQLVESASTVTVTYTINEE